MDGRGKIKANIPYYPQGDTREFLPDLDVHILRDLSEVLSGSGGRWQRALGFLEVGVWKGGWSISALMNFPNSAVIGIDPYPGAEIIRVELLRRVKEMELSSRFHLFPDWKEIPENQEFDIIHIDGLHTETAVETDLNNASARLASGGVIIVDDYNHRYFPGIWNVLSRFLSRGEFSMFLGSRQKAYLCRVQNHEDFRRTFLNLREGSQPYRLERYFGEVDALDEQWAQLPTVNGLPTLIASEMA